jgi:hypothetical protein
LAVRNDWNTDEVKALENSGISDGFLESFWHAQSTNCELFDVSMLPCVNPTNPLSGKRPIKGETLEDAVPTHVLEAEVKHLACQSVYQHVEKIDRLLKNMAPAVSMQF